MLDLKSLLENKAVMSANLTKRGVDTTVFDILSRLDSERRELIQKSEGLKSKLNQKSQEIGQRKKAGENCEELILETKNFGEQIKSLDEELSGVEQKLNSELMMIPNLSHHTVPDGKSEADNKVMRKWGLKKEMDFIPKDHVELGESLGILDFKKASRLSGARYSVLRGDGARLERALTQFMLDVQTREKGYEEMEVPYIVNRDALIGTGQLPKFEEDLYKLSGSESYLIPTAEVPLTGLYRGETLSEDELPMQFTAFTPCFRSEAGSYGKDTRGLIRQHQFHKVELVHYTHPNMSFETLEELTNNAEEILIRLGLHYRVVALCKGDLGFGAAKTYDLEVWLPGQNDGKGAYREISSCSNCTDFQARRSKIRFKPKDGGKPQFIHTLNGSGLAVGRTWIAVVENYQNKDGSITIPEVLVPYMGGQTEIRPNS